MSKRGTGKGESVKSDTKATTTPEVANLETTSARAVAGPNSTTPIIGGSLPKSEGKSLITKLSTLADPVADEKRSPLLREMTLQTKGSGKKKKKSGHVPAGGEEVKRGKSIMLLSHFGTTRVLFGTLEPSAIEAVEYSFKKECLTLCLDAHAAEWFMTDYAPSKRLVFSEFKERQLRTSLPEQQLRVLKIIKEEYRYEESVAEVLERLISHVAKKCKTVEEMWKIAMDYNDGRTIKSHRASSPTKSARGSSSTTAADSVSAVATEVHSD